MTVEHTQNGSITTYNDEEWDFIDTLPANARKWILMGLATPYTYGYKPSNESN